MQSVEHLRARTTPLDANDAAAERERANKLTACGILGRIQPPLSLMHIARCSVWSTLLANALALDESEQSRSMADSIAQLGLPALLTAFIRFE